MFKENRLIVCAACIALACILAFALKHETQRELLLIDEDRQARQEATRNVLDSCEEHAGRFDERACMLARHEELMTRLERLERILLDTQRGWATPRD